MLRTKSNNSKPKFQIVSKIKKKTNLVNQRLYKVSCPQGNFSETVAKNHEIYRFYLFSLSQIKHYYCFFPAVTCKQKKNNAYFNKLKFKLCIYLLNLLQRQKHTNEKKYENNYFVKCFILTLSTHDPFY